MKLMEMDGDTPFLPNEIIRDIFIRLPVKSILRFQCVCKDWKNLFKSLAFIADHLHHSSHRNPFLLLKCYCSCKLCHFCLLDDEVDIQERHKVPLKNSKLIVRDLHSNHGLLCLEVTNKTHSLLLYNPATKEVRQVPRRLKLFKDMDFTVGFGFNPIVNDYKIVRLFISLHEEMVVKVEVYSLSMGSWKEVEVGNLAVVQLRYDKSYTANGAIFWFGYSFEYKVDEGKKGEYVFNDWIVSFDMAMEVSTLIPMPAEMSYKDGIRFTVYDHSLAILYPTTIENSETSSIDLWVMEEGTGAFGEKWRWTKKYTSNPFPCPYPWILCPQTIWRNKIICRIDVKPEAYGKVKDDGTKIVMFNLNSNEIKGYAIGISGSGHNMFNYAESLVPL
ncbi:hypothetical protein K1719_025841 [Acacia pycnantha]|nr:hypothetical protein K1719_025841 [Acacia pycnantha]